MGSPTKIQKIIWWIQELPQRIKQSFCPHKLELDMREMVKQKWERCSGGENCSRCGLPMNYTVYLTEKP